MEVALPSSRKTTASPSIGASSAGANRLRDPRETVGEVGAATCPELDPFALLCRREGAAITLDSTIINFLSTRLGDD